MDPYVTSSHDEQSVIALHCFPQQIHEHVTQPANSFFVVYLEAQPSPSFKDNLK
jgi:hypothetical protein